MRWDDIVPLRLIIPNISGIFNTEKSQIIETTSEVVFIISYEPLRNTMRRKGITTYALIKDYSFSRGTLDSLKHNRNISTATLNDLCNILSCKVEDVLAHIPDKT